MTTASKAIGLLLLLGSLIGCAAKSPSVRVPPRVDLSQHETIGVIEFRSRRFRHLRTALSLVGMGRCPVRLDSRLAEIERGRLIEASLPSSPFAR